MGTAVAGVVGAWAMMALVVVLGSIDWYQCDGWLDSCGGGWLWGLGRCARRWHRWPTRAPADGAGDVVAAAVVVAAVDAGRAASTSCAVNGVACDHDGVVETDGGTDDDGDDCDKVCGRCVRLLVALLLLLLLGLPPSARDVSLADAISGGSFNAIGTRHADSVSDWSW